MIAIERRKTPTMGMPVESRVAEERAAHEAPRTDSSNIVDRFGAAPWWFVSATMHILIIALASLVSMSIELPRDTDAVIMMTELQERVSLKSEQVEKKPDLLDVLAKTQNAATDKDSTEASEIVVPPDILAKAELGDHFETINPELPDTHSALGNPESHSFHSVEGNTEPEGGGGMSGLGSDDLIGVGGAASKGSGGGFGGGDGTGVGVGSGAGRGSFGNRNGGGRKLMVKRHGGSAATESAVDKALEWLAYHQEADGHWDTKKYEATDCVDAAITGLATLAFLGAGHSEKVGKYKDNVQRAVAWMIAKQEASGSIGKDYLETWHGGYAYHHAICGLALAEAAGMARIPATVEAAEKALKYSTEIMQGGENSERKAWRYAPKMDADSSVSGWFVMQLKSAKIAGLHVDPACFEGALHFY